MCQCLAKFVEIDIDIDDGTFGCNCPKHKRNDDSLKPSKKARHVPGCFFSFYSQKKPNIRSIVSSDKMEMVNLIKAKMISGVKRVKKGNKQPDLGKTMNKAVVSSEVK